MTWGLLLLAIAGCAPSEAHKVQAALAYGRLPPLPAAADEVCVETVGNMFARTFWLRFRLEQPDAAAFLRPSEDLVLLEGEERTRFERKMAEYGATEPCAPPAFTGDSVRIYEVPQDADALWGHVVWDQINDVVYIRVHHS